MHYCSRTLFPSLIGLFFVFQWKTGFKKMCWFDVDFQNNSKVTEVLGPRPLTYMCPPPLQKGVKYSFCEPLNTCIYIHKIKLVDLFPHTILKLLLYHMTWTHQTLLQVTYSHVQWITLSYNVNLSNSAIRQIRVLSIHNYV